MDYYRTGSDYFDKFNRLSRERRAQLDTEAETPLSKDIQYTYIAEGLDAMRECTTLGIDKKTLYAAQDFIHALSDIQPTVESIHNNPSEWRKWFYDSNQTIKDLLCCSVDQAVKRLITENINLRDYLEGFINPNTRHISNEEKLKGAEVLQVYNAYEKARRLEK